MMESGTSMMLGENSSTAYHLDAATKFGLVNPVPAPDMTYDQVFPGLPETSVNSQADRTIGKWNTKLRVGSRNVTQVSWKATISFICCYFFLLLFNYNLHLQYRSFTSHMKSVDLKHQTSLAKVIFSRHVLISCNLQEQLLKLPMQKTNLWHLLLLVIQFSTNVMSFTK